MKKRELQHLKSKQRRLRFKTDRIKIWLIKKMMLHLSLSTWRIGLRTKWKLKHRKVHRTKKVWDTHLKALVLMEIKTKIEARLILHFSQLLQMTLEIWKSNFQETQHCKMKIWRETKLGPIDMECKETMVTVMRLQNKSRTKI